jgi:hypothetical protein
VTGILCALVGSGGGGPLIQLTTPRTIAYNSGGILSAQAGYGLDPNSYVYTAANSNGSYSQSEQWDSIPATTSNYQVRATLNSGDTPTGSALATWLTVSTFRSWLLNASAGTLLTCNLTIEVRDIATSTVQATATVTLRANAV